MNDITLCGVILTEANEITDVYFTREDNGNNELFYNNDPYGVVSIYGLKDLSIKGIERYSYDNEGNCNESKLDDKYTYIYSALATKARGESMGIVLLEDGLLFITNTSPFEALIQPLRLGEKPNKAYSGYVDVTDVEEGTDDYDTLTGVFCIV